MLNNTFSIFPALFYHRKILSVNSTKIGYTFGQDIFDIFKCGNMGGMRRSHKTNNLVLIEDHTKGFYKDRWIQDELHYTGMGKEGNQDLTYLQNKTLLNSPNSYIELHLFEVHKKNEYVYHGQVYLLSEPYESEQEDHKGKTRRVWIFPLKVLD